MHARPCLKSTLLGFICLQEENFLTASQDYGPILPQFCHIHLLVDLTQMGRPRNSCVISGSGLFASNCSICSYWALAAVYNGLREDVGINLGNRHDLAYLCYSSSLSKFK